ncbi:MAG: tetratricopeptide repeat protein [Acidobacteriota bacterium]
MRTDLKRLALPICLISVTAAGAMPAQRGGAIENRAATLEKQVGELQAGQQAILTRLNQIHLDLDNSLEPLRVNLADHGEQMRGLESRLVALEEQLSLATEDIARLTARLAGGQDRLNTQPTASGAMPMPMPQRPAGLAGPTVARQTQQPAPQSDAATLYSTAYTDYLSANYELAISDFQEFLRRYPRSEQADNAQYWVGESLYSQDLYQRARAAFLEIPRRYPDADTIPDALFKAAQCLIDLGESDQGVEEFKDLIRAHPLSGPTRIACLQLERLKVEKPPACPSH